MTAMRPPYTVLEALFVINAITTGLLWWQDNRSILAGHCRACGYDLTGNVSGRCPECGKEIDLEGASLVTQDQPQRGDGQ